MRKKKSKSKLKPDTRPISVVARIRLKQIRLRHAESSLTIKGGNIPTKLGISVTMSVGVSKGEKLVKGDVACAVDSFYEGDKEPSVFIRCTYQLLYNVTDEKTPTKAELKSESQGILAMIAFQAWPYIRQHIHTDCLRMGLPALTLAPLVMGQNADGSITVQLQPQIQGISK